jgi:predicted nucleotidyltransferase
MVSMTHVGIDRELLTEFCMAHHVRKLAIFGSALREDFRPDSDVDVLVEFELGREPGLSFFAMQDELSRLFGRSVDLNTLGFLSPEIRSRVMSEAKTQYEQA